MYKGSPFRDATNNLDTILSRYMSFAKFVSILSTNSLFFPSIATLRNADKFEGYIAPNDTAGKDDEERLWIVNQYERLHRLTAVSCWYMGTEESVAMWRLYDDAIVIQTTLGLLIESLDGFSSITNTGISSPVEYYGGPVKYVPSANYQIPAHNAFYPVFHKRKGYDFEQEFRLAVYLAISDRFTDEYTYFFGGPDETQFPSLNQQIETNKGILHPLNSNKFIQSVGISPRAEPWLLDTVKATMEKFGVNTNLVSISKSTI